MSSPGLGNELTEKAVRAQPCEAWESGICVARASGSNEPRQVGPHEVLGSRHSWGAAQPRSRPSRWPTRSHASPGPSWCTGHAIENRYFRLLETSAGTRSRSRGWKGQMTNNAPSRSIRRSGHPTLATAAPRLRAYDRDLICGEHYGQRPSKSAATTGRTDGSTDQHCITVKKNPLPAGSRPQMAKSGRK